MNPAENYILHQPEPYRFILLHLQVIIEHACDVLELKYKYNIPFYYIKGKPFCYLNANHKKQYIDLGFWKGNQIQIYQEHLVTENRKMMVSLRYKALEEINDKILIEVLKEAQSLY